MTLDEFKKKIIETKKANLEVMEDVRKFNDKNDTEEDIDFEEGYNSALTYVLKLLEEVK